MLEPFEVLPKFGDGDKYEKREERTGLSIPRALLKSLLEDFRVSADQVGRDSRLTQGLTKSLHPH